MILILTNISEASETSYFRYGLTLSELQQYLSIMTIISKEEILHVLNNKELLIYCV